MIRISPRGKGKPDHTIDIAVSTVPMIVRHQTRFVASIIAKDVNATLTSQADDAVFALALKISDAAGKTYFPMWVHGGISLYRRISIRSAIIDFDKFVEYALGIKQWDTEDLIIREFGKNDGFGVVEIEYSPYSPIVVEYPEDPEPSTYFPNYVKYAWAGIITVYGTPGENLSFDVWFSATGMVSSYPWWV